MNAEVSRRVAQGALVAVVALVAAGSLPEACADIPDLNDNVLHLAVARAASDALAHGQNPTDAWVPEIAEGYPVMHHYQHLPHLVVALLHRASFGLVSLRSWLRWTSWLLLLLLPLSVAWSTRRLGLDPLAATFAGVACALVSAPGLYGLELSSFGWGGFGLTSQLWGVVLMGPVWVALKRALDGRGGLALAGTGLALLIVTHTVLAWVTLISGLVWALVPTAALDSSWGGWARWRVARLAMAYGVAAVAASYFVLPFLLDRAALNRSVWEPAEKVDGRGLGWVLARLLSGDLFDYGDRIWRAPVLTVLLLAGAVWVGVRWRRHGAARPFLILFVGWLLLFFGRPTWGAALDLLPLAEHLHVHRLIVPLQWCGVGLIGVSLAGLWRVGLGRAPSRRRFAATLAVLTLLLGSAAFERFSHLRARWGWVASTQAAWTADDGAATRALTTVQHAGPGRAYAGRAPNWGGAYRLGAVPFYALLPAHGIDTLGYLYHAMSATGDVDGYFDITRPAHVDLFNIRYLVAPASQPVPTGATLRFQEGRHRVYELPTSGYQTLIDVPVALAGNRDSWFPAARAWLQSAAVEAGQHPALFIDRRADWPAEVAPIARLSAMTSTWAPASPCGRVVEEKVGRGRYRGTVEAGRDCWLMLKATYHPHWRAWVDGEERTPIMVAPSYAAIPIAAGTHETEWRYDPGWSRTLLLVIGLGAVLALAVWERRRRTAGVANGESGCGP